MTKIDEPTRPTDRINGRPLHYDPSADKWYRQAGPDDEPHLLLLPYDPADDHVAMAWRAWRFDLSQPG